MVSEPELIDYHQGVTSPLAGQMFFRASLFSTFGASKRWLGTNADGSARTLTYSDFYMVRICFETTVLKLLDWKGYTRSPLKQVVERGQSLLCSTLSNDRITF